MSVIMVIGSLIMSVALPDYRLSAMHTNSPRAVTGGFSVKSAR
jgi:hypothetical protein